MANKTDNSSQRRTKVARLIDEHGFGDIGIELERRWTAEGDERMSLRDLADYFNRRLLATAMEEHGMQPLDGEVENVYRLLTANDVSDADRTRVRRRLEREGVDVDSLSDDFVSYQAVRTYLRKDRGAAYETDDRDRTTVEADNLQRLRGRVSAIMESKMDQLRDGGHLSLGEFRTFVELRVHCQECNRQFEVGELLERGGCDCTDSRPT